MFFHEHAFTNAVRVISLRNLKTVICKLLHRTHSLACIISVSYFDDCTHSNYTQLTSKAGYIALKSRNNNWNSICPWTVKTEPGRLINISGVNFGAIRDQKGPYLHKITPCPFYVKFSEEGHSKKQSLCYIENKLHMIYTSRTNVVDVRLMIVKAEVDVWKQFRPVILHYNGELMINRLGVLILTPCLTSCQINSS